MRLLVSAALVALSSADCYFHSPRGSNNRLDDENRDRNNANRLFDSQNNNRGGANVGNLYYFEGSTLAMEWSQQHSCGGPNNHCELILQYMCDERLRDGTTQRTIPINKEECYDWDCDADTRFGRHESLSWYQGCMYRERNKGLFTSTQKLKGQSARFTRQNPNGARRGLECPEERDYYPYWAPSPWKDLMVMTNDDRRCDMYRTESENVKSRWFCEPPFGMDMHDLKEGQIPISKDKCEAWEYENEETSEKSYGLWTESPSHGLPPPVCRRNIESRDNHHGNVAGGQWSGYNLTIPSFPAPKKGEAPVATEQCVFRIRYNISTGDHPHIEEDVAGTAELNAAQNGVEEANYGGIAERMCIDYNSSDPLIAEAAHAREYHLKNNPQVDMFGDILDEPNIQLQLAVNTAQFGRTFEDRSHRVAFRKAPKNKCNVIHNIEVRGKRGNIVQTYPGTEYDFSPNRVQCGVGSCVHFQWTGSNTNPNNNAGQGRQGSDRSNAVLMGTRQRDWKDERGRQEVNGLWGSSYPADLSSDFLGMSDALKQKMAILEPHFGGELSELDDAGVYFDSGLIPCKAESLGVYHYMSTRNNNFSNRSQKGKVVVSKYESMAMIASPMTATNIGDNRCRFRSASGVLARAAVVNVLCKADKDTAEISVNGDIETESGRSFQVEVALTEAQRMEKASMWYSPTGAEGTFSEIEATCDGVRCTAQGTKAGVYRVTSEPNWAVIIPCTIVGLLLAGVATFFIVRHIRAKKSAAGGMKSQSLRNNI